MRRILFLGLAIVVAGATFFLARVYLQPETPTTQSQAVPAPVTPSMQVLVARNTIRTGQIVKPDDLRWQAWPPEILSPAYVVDGKRKMSDFVGAVARLPVKEGEPVTEGRLVLPGTRGFMAAVLQPGMRAVSVPVSATSSVSGFIYAGDRVDVLLTHVLGREQGQQGGHVATETILRNAHVIAMDQKVDFAPGDKPELAKTATLELTPKQSEMVTLALKMGELSLALRSLQESDRVPLDPAVLENGPAAPGDSYTQDGEVSRLIKPAPPPPAPDTAASLVVLRGVNSSKQDLDGQPPAGGDNGRAAPPAAAAPPATARGSRP